MHAVVEGRIVGFAVWTLMKEPPPEELGMVEEDVNEVWGNEVEREFTRRGLEGVCAATEEGSAGSRG